MNYLMPPGFLILPVFTSRRIFAAQVTMAAFFLLTSGETAAQELHLGITAGLNRAGMQEFRFRYASNNLETESPGYRTGVHAGLFAELAWPAFSIRPELSYSRKGFEFESGNAKVDARLNYIDIPVLLKYRLSSRFFLLGGPQVSFLTTTEYAYSGEHRDYRLKADGIDLSLLVGAGVTLGRFDISARYGHGLMPIFRDDGIRSDQTRLGQLSVGFRMFSVNE